MIFHNRETTKFSPYAPSLRSPTQSVSSSTLMSTSTTTTTTGSNSRRLFSHVPGALIGGIVGGIGGIITGVVIYFVIRSRRHYKQLQKQLGGSQAFLSPPEMGQHGGSGDMRAPSELGGAYSSYPSHPSLPSHPMTASHLLHYTQSQLMQVPQSPFPHDSEYGHEAASRMYYPNTHYPGPYGTYPVVVATPPPVHAPRPRRFGGLPSFFGLSRRSSQQTMRTTSPNAFASISGLSSPPPHIGLVSPAPPSYRTDGAGYPHSVMSPPLVPMTPHSTSITPSARGLQFSPQFSPMILSAPVIPASYFGPHSPLGLSPTGQPYSPQGFHPFNGQVSSPTGAEFPAEPLPPSSIPPDEVLAQAISTSLPPPTESEAGISLGVEAISSSSSTKSEAEPVQLSEHSGSSSLLLPLVPSPASVLVLETAPTAAHVEGRIYS